METKTQVSDCSAVLVLLPKSISHNMLDSCDTLSTSINKALLPTQNFSTHGLPECYVRLVRLPENITLNQAVKASEFNSFECVNTSQQHISSEKCHYIELDNHSSYCLTCKQLIQDFHQFKQNVQSRGNESSFCRSMFNRQKGLEWRGLSVHDNKSSAVAVETELNLNEHEEKDQDQNLINKQKRKIYVYKCSVCPKRYIHKGSLVDHMKSHTNEKSFKYPASDYSATKIFETTDPIVAANQNLKDDSEHTEEDEHKDVELKNEEAIKVETETNSKIICSTSESHFEEDMLEPHFEDIKIEILEANDPIVAENFKLDFEEDEFKKNVQSQRKESSLCSSDTKLMEAEQFPCHICQNIYTTKVSFQYHMKLHKIQTEPKNVAVVCPICNKRILNSNLKRHMLTHTGEKPFACDVCLKRYTSKDSLEFHLKSHTGEKPFCCTKCDYSAKTNKQVRQHYNNMHAVKVANSDGNNVKQKKKVCPICNIKILHLKRHMLTHTGEKPFQCNICQKCYTAKHSLEYHIQLHTEEKPFRCTECDYSAKTNIQVRRHYNRMHAVKVANSGGNNVKPKKKVCPICNIKIRDLKPHMLTHTGEKPFQCNICQKCYTTKASLEYHIKSHAEEKPFRCTECDYSARTDEQVRSHYNHIHAVKVANSDGNSVDTRKTAVCPVCNKRILNLKRHLLTHTGKKLFECSICYMRYKSKNSLEFHLKSHTGEKPFRCTECDYSAKTNKQVERHYNRIHAVKVANSDGNNVRPKKQVCPICNVKILQLKRHMLTHTGEKPFQCNICQKCYSTKKSLEYHIIQSHTEEKPFCCPECDYSAKTNKQVRKHYNRIHAVKVANSDGTVNTKKTTICRISDKKILDLNLKRHSKDSLEYYVKSHTEKIPFCCPKCDYSAKWNRDVRQHYNRIHAVKVANTDGTVNTKKTSDCPICNKTILQLNLKGHMLTHTGEKLFKCNICQKCCTAKSSLEYHIKSHIEEKPFRCTECDYSAKTDEQVRSHYNHMHTVKVPNPDGDNVKTRETTVCPICNIKILDLKRHMLTHTGEKPFECNICHNRYITKYSLEYHIKSHTGEKPFRCIKYDYSAKTNKQLRYHYNCKHTDKVKRAKTSNILEAVSPTVAVVNFEHNFEEPEHIQNSIHKEVEVKGKAIQVNTHTEVKTKTREVTDLKEQPEYLQTIKPEEVQIKDELTCEDNPVFTAVPEGEDDLGKPPHISTAEQPYACYVCKFETADGDNFKRHMLSHKRDKLFTCNLCEFKTAYKRNLKTHMYIHLDDKPFTCSSCNFKTVCRQYLKRHMRTHSGEKPFVCSMCEFKTAHKHSLEQHLRIHAG